MGLACSSLFVHVALPCATALLYGPRDNGDREVIDPKREPNSCAQMKMFNSSLGQLEGVTCNQWQASATGANSVPGQFRYKCQLCASPFQIQSPATTKPAFLVSWGLNRGPPGLKV